MKIITMPKPIRMFWVSLVAYWLAGIISPAFIAIAVLIALFIPVLIVESNFSARPEA
ncbi:MAG: hypothetical protein NTX38_03980 [Methylobacter sp.]|nr:hypothetical protein [Methylobacter sp.]